MRAPAPNRQPLHLTAQIRAIEQAAGSAGLMEKAGLAAATLARDLCDDSGRPILIVAGPGNNGGDALVAARHLKYGWHHVDLVFAGTPEKLSADARSALEAWLACGGTLAAEIPPGKSYGLVIDGLFGIGLSRPPEGFHAELVRQINALGAPVLALDIPSGLCADTGRVLGTAVKADHTLTFLGLKPGLFTLEGPEQTGTVHLCDLGVDAIPTPGSLLDAPPALPAARRKNAHKGSNGSVGVLGGETAMTGAALLAARAALLCGAGRVYAGLLAEHEPAWDAGQPELMLRSATALLDLNHLSVLVAGPGMGRSGHAATLLQRAIHYPAPLLLDADALALLAENSELRSQFIQRPHAATLTPHPGEAATLLGCSVAEIQADRIGAALAIARDYQALTLLKGCGSIVAAPDGRWSVNASGNPGLAAAGMGDVLAGIIGSLAAQGMTLEQATLLGTYLHGAAADALVAGGSGPVGLTASEVAWQARHLLNQWIYPTCKTS